MESIRLENTERRVKKGILPSIGHLRDNVFVNMGNIKLFQNFGKIENFRYF